MSNLILGKFALENLYFSTLPPLIRERLDTRMDVTQRKEDASGLTPPPHGEMKRHTIRKKSRKITQIYTGLKKIAANGGRVTTTEKGCPCHAVSSA
jgi:hypothetical protein